MGANLMQPIQNVVVAAEVDGRVVMVNLPQDKLAFLFSVSCQLTDDSQVPVITAPEWLDVPKAAAWLETINKEAAGEEPHH